MRIVRVASGAALAAGLVLASVSVAAKGTDKAKGKPAATEPKVATSGALIGADVDAAVKDAQALGGAADPKAHDALLDALATGCIRRSPRPRSPRWPGTRRPPTCRSC